MKITIDEHIEVLKSYHHGFTGYAGNLQDSIDVAIDTMRKYQKIEQIYNKYHCTMVSMARITQVIKGDEKDGNDK